MGILKGPTSLYHVSFSTLASSFSGKALAKKAGFTYLSWSNAHIAEQDVTNWMVETLSTHGANTTDDDDDDDDNDSDDDDEIFLLFYYYLYTCCLS